MDPLKQFRRQDDAAALANAHASRKQLHEQTFPSVLTQAFAGCRFDNARFDAER